MALSRLQNLGSNPKGVQLYVDPGNFDATDGIENRGNSNLKPFVSIQRALLEAARYSYLPGENNDLNNRTTIILSSGVHYIDNRPGLSITNSSGTAVFKKRTGFTQWSLDTLTELNEDSIFDLLNPNNVLYKFNSVEGGVIAPRGTSIVSLDPSKTNIRPLYIPDPNNDEVENSSILKMTGNCYFDSLLILDADTSIGVYTDYTYKLVTPKFSHHKLSRYTFADGVNKVKLGNEQTDFTDLQMYYYKLSIAYGSISGRQIADFPSSIDFEPLLDEYQIISPIEDKLLGISSIRSGDGDGGGVLNELTITTKDINSGLDTPHNFNKNTPIIISGITINPDSYNGSFIVKSIVGLNTFTCITNSIPSVKLPTSGQIANAVIKPESDTVSSASPRIHNCQSKSVYGMCGILADGNKVSGVKSVIVSYYSGTSLQKDDNAFLLYSKTSNNYLTTNQISQDSTNKPLYTNSSSIYKPSYESYLIKAINNAIIKAESVSAEGYSKKFVTETGGNISIINSSSNYGALSFESSGFSNTSFDRDDTGVITHIVPPRNLNPTNSNIEWLSIDVGLTTAIGNESNKRLYLYGYDDVNKVPPHKIEEFRVGAKVNDTLNLGIGNTTYSSPILMPVTIGAGGTATKTYQVQRVSNVNSITTDTLTFTSNHQLENGEKVKIISDTGELPDGLANNTIYYVIKTSNANQIKLASTFNSATATTPLSITGISNNGGITYVVSTISDKKPFDVGHPIQWDSTVRNWYLNSSTDSSNNIHTILKQLGTSSLSRISARTFITRKIDNRSIEDRLYKVRYVIPKNYTNTRPPTVGYILQETKTVGGSVASSDSTTSLTFLDRRNERIINSITAGTISNNSQVVTAKTETPHRLIIGDSIKVSNVTSTYNPSSVGITSTFNGSFVVLSTPDSRTFTYRITGVSTNPGVFTNILNTRNSNTIDSLPIVSREKYKNTFVVYKVDTIKEHIPGSNGQDGVYYVTLLGSNVKTTSRIGYGLSSIEYKQDVRDLYPQLDRDNYSIDSASAVSYADHLVIGKTLTNDKRNSITKETVEYLLQNNQIGFGITSLVLSGVGNTTITIQTDVEHKLNSIRGITLTSGGTGQSGYYYGSRVTVGSTVTDAVCNYNTSAGAIVSNSIEFIDFGSSFTVGQTIGIGTLGATATISSINSNISDGLELSGFTQSELNNVFRINSIPNSKTIVLESSYPISSYTPTTNSRTPFGFISAKAVNISSYLFTDLSTGIVTATTSIPHGLLEGNNFKIVGSGSSIYNSDFIVNSIGSATTFTFKVENVTQIPSATSGTIYRRTLYPNAKSVGNLEENLGSRLSYIYGGVVGIISSITDTNVTFTTNDTGLNRGDYIQVNNEIIRLTQRLSNSFNIERGVFGSIKTDIATNTPAFKIKVLPVELRTPSFIKATNHRIENIGYGPGNYSTSAPQRQNRNLSEDEVIAAHTRQVSGGSVVIEGINEFGELYRDSKKVNSFTGQETTINSPVLTFTGDDAENETLNLSTNDINKLLIRHSVIVEGGENSENISIFNGPVKFNKAISSIQGINSKHISLNTKKFSYNNSEIVSKDESPNIGDILFSKVPANYIGKIKFTGNSWRRWGLISNTENTWEADLDKITVADLNVTNSLTINGVAFNSGGISDLVVNRLRVIGISTFQGDIYGNNGIVGFANTIGVTNGISTTYIRGDGGIIDIGVTSTFSEYGLRITRSSINLNPKSEILHKGTGTFDIKAVDAVGGAGISLNPNGIVYISKNSNSAGTSGAHLSILNTNTTTPNNSDSIISWKGGNTGYWFAGMRGQDSSWNLAYAASPIGITNGSFITHTKVGVSTNGTISAPEFVGAGIIPVGGIIIWSGTLQAASNLGPSWTLCDGSTVNGITTPDLRGRFIIGSNSTNYNPGNTGGSADAVVVDHTHRPNFYNPSGSTDLDDRYNFALTNFGLPSRPRPATSILVAETNPAGLGAAVKTAGAVFNPEGTVEIGTTSAGKNLPPYYALAYIMRVR